MSNPNRAWNGSLGLNSHRDRLEHAAEKNGPIRPLPARPVRYLSESFAGGSVMTCCNEFTCVCTCPVCGDKSITGTLCEGCSTCETCGEGRHDGACEQDTASEYDVNGVRGLVEAY